MLEAQDAPQRAFQKKKATHSNNLSDPIWKAIWACKVPPKVRVWCGDGFGSDTHGYEFGCHYLSHFSLNSDMNTNIIEYEYKMDISNSDSHSNTYSIYIMSINFICGWFYS
jgi:hypothetical protein